MSTDNLDRVAIVTGGGSGVGRASTLALLEAGWSVVIAGRRAERLDETVALGGDYRFAPAGDGSESVVWTFDDLVMGAEYEVFATWPASANFASNAPFTISGAGVPQVVTVDQRVSPTGDTLMARPWLNIGTVAATFNGSVQIQLSNLADGIVAAT